MEVDLKSENLNIWKELLLIINVPFYLSKRVHEGLHPNYTNIYINVHIYVWITFFLIIYTKNNNMQLTRLVFLQECVCSEWWQTVMARTVQSDGRRSWPAQFREMTDGPGPYSSEWWQTVGCTSWGPPNLGVTEPTLKPSAAFSHLS